MTDLTYHDCLMLNAAMLAYATPDQRATALALARIAGATSDRGTIAGSLAGFVGLMVLAWRERPVPRRRGRG